MKVNECSDSLRRFLLADNTETNCLLSVFCLNINCYINNSQLGPPFPTGLMCIYINQLHINFKIIIGTFNYYLCRSDSHSYL